MADNLRNIGAALCEDPRLFRFGKKSNARQVTAVVVDRQGVAVASVESKNSERPLLTLCHYLPVAPGADLAATLKQAVKEHGLGGHPCTTLMDLGSYHLLLARTPDVPPDELRAAIRWQIKDSIDFHIDDAVLDVFDAPPSGASGRQDSMYVVVCRGSVVEERAGLLQDAGISLDVIDIPELALRNIASYLPQEQGGIALLHLADQHGLITLCRESTLYLARTLDVGHRQLQAAIASADADRLSRLLDGISLEVQRSVDYYDSHFRMAPIREIVLSPLPFEETGLENTLTNNLGITVRTLGIDELVDGFKPVDQAQEAHCLLAVGTALRTEPTSL